MSIPNYRHLHYFRPRQQVLHSRCFPLNNVIQYLQRSVNHLDRLQHVLYFLSHLEKAVPARSSTPEARMTPASAQVEARAMDAPGGELRRVLGLWDLAFMIVGTVIGSGIFLVPGPILRNVGHSVPQAFAVWLGGGLLSL